MRYFLLVLSICFIFSLTACSTKDAQYYRLHPQALQEVLKNCPQFKSPQITCAQLVSVADEVNSLAYQLQRDPQGFGQRILTLQIKLAQLEVDLKKNSRNAHLSVQIEQDKQALAEYLAVVKWLESPEK